MGLTLSGQERIFFDTAPFIYWKKVNELRVVTLDEL